MRIPFKGKSIRWRIMFCVISAVFFMTLYLLVIIFLNQRMIGRLGESYQTNTQLTEISTQLGNMEKSLENYIAYRTFESIDSFYHFQAASEELIYWFPEYPSTDKVLQKEYVVKQLIMTLYSFGKYAVVAQRANNEYKAQDSYKKCLVCYDMLQSQIEELNILLMRRNADVYSENRGRLLILTQLSCAMIFVFFILVFILVYMSVTAITKPLSELSSVALRIAQKDFEVPLFNNNDSTEIGTICRAFDRMTISIRDYIDQIWEKAAKETELREKEMEARELYAAAQLRALQNQINPHFLFNTLNTGAQLAMIEGADKTCYFMEQVADFFRYNISQKGQAATIDEELALIDNFVYIMKVRFGERFEFVKNVSNEKHLQRLPRMILQPLVENCIKHGYNGTKIRVELSVEPELYMTKVSVSDNGAGFDPELKKTLLSLNPEVKDVEKADSGQLDSEKQVSKSAEGNGTGLVNVISRLRLYFHRYDVFDILENEGGGTKFLLRIPNV